MSPSITRKNINLDKIVVKDDRNRLFLSCIAKLIAVHKDEASQGLLVWKICYKERFLGVRMMIMLSSNIDQYKTKTLFYSIEN